MANPPSEGYRGRRRRFRAWLAWSSSVAIALAIGVLATVGVAWAFALHGRLMHVELRQPQWAIAPPSDWPDRPATGYDFVGTGVSQMRCWVQGVRIDRNEPVDFHQLVWATGWPFRALCSEHRSAPGDDQRWIDPGTPGPPPVTGWRHAWIIDASAAQRGIMGIPGLPLRPLWPGFAWCVLCYGAIAWLLMVVPLVLRMRRRRRRGACLHCGHQLLHGAVRCTECGADYAPGPAASAGAALPPGAASSASHSATLSRI